MDRSQLFQEGRDWTAWAGVIFVVAFFALIIGSMIYLGYGYALLGLLLLAVRLVLLFLNWAGLAIAVVALIIAIAAALFGRQSIAVLAIIIAFMALLGWFFSGLYLAILAPLNPAPPPGHWDP